MTIENINSVTTDFGYLPLPESRLLTDQQSITIDMLDTENPIFENFFLPWMQEVTADTYMYKHRPFMKADVTIIYFTSPTFTEVEIKPVSFLKYKFHGCFPNDITSRPANHNPQGGIETRTVRMQFETMSVDSNKDKMKTAYGRG